MPTLEGSITAGSGLAKVRPESVTVSPDPAGTSTVSSVAVLGPGVLAGRIGDRRVDPTGVLVVKGDAA